MKNLEQIRTTLQNCEQLNKQSALIKGGFSDFFEIGDDDKRRERPGKKNVY